MSRKDAPAPASEVIGSEDDAYLSPPVQRAARLLRHIGEGDSVGNMSRTARTLGINRTTLLRLLRTLEAERFIEARADGAGYRIGLGLIGLAAHSFFSEDLVQTAVPVVTHLAEQLGLSAHLGVLDGVDIVYVLRRTPNLAFASTIRVGSRLPAHAAVMGRAILAFVSPDRVRRLFEGVAMQATTSHTAVTVAQLQNRLAQDRGNGIAWSDGFYEDGISSVAAPIFDASASPVAAINVSGQTASFGDQASRVGVGRAVRAAADEISHRLGWHGALPATVEAQHLPSQTSAKSGMANRGAGRLRGDLGRRMGSRPPTAAV